MARAFTKAAALFHSLTCNHCFTNGNKRTAVFGLNIFLAINDRYLALSSDDVYLLAKETAQANETERNTEQLLDRLTHRIAAASIDPAALSAISELEEWREKMEKSIALFRTFIATSA